MNIIEPKVEVKEKEVLSVKDIVLDTFGETHFVAKLIDKKYAVISLNGHWANGSYHTLEELSENTIGQGWVKKIYRSSEYDLQLVPKQK